MIGQSSGSMSSSDWATHIEFDDVVDQIAGHRLAIHLVNDHLLQKQWEKRQAIYLQRERSAERGGEGRKRELYN